MKFLLKIVQGPNAGAEIALVEGVRVTLGSADSCDIVLADPTLAAEACAIEASADSVVLSVSGSEPERLEPLRVRSFGSTALAVGPADSPWGPLVWEAPAGGDTAAAGTDEARSPSAPEASDTGDSGAFGPSGPSSTPSADGAKPLPAAPPSRGRGRRVGCLVLLLLALLFAAWLLTRRWRTVSESPEAFASPEPTTADSPSDPAAIVARLGLTVLETGDGVVYRGDFATRAERRAATDELYKAQPGAALDLADRETLMTATSDLLQAATDGAIAVSDVTNRVAVLSGRAPDPATLRAWREALLADVPRLSGADTAAIVLDSPVSAPVAPGSVARPARALPHLPGRLRCILLQPVPCLVLQDGERLFKGTPVDGYKISEIAFDRIVFRNDQGEEIEWMP
ncbi:MAG: hypothetical protein IJL06_00075 [Kiritimatiellae bacterium]|nr:hypothetical protein [Kiritimatiellia bacterium]MBQ6925429.1 hypothetical protein [Kiritimatiellia bacterium]